MSGHEDEEEDELQRILEGRDVEEYNHHLDRRHRHSTRSDSDDEDEPQHTSRRDYRHKKSNKDTDEAIEGKRVKRPLIDDNSGDHSVDKTGRKREDVDTYSTNEDNGTKVVAKVRRIASKPKPKLNADKLMTKEGIALLTHIFKDIRLRGKGSELKDLNEVMFRLSHWSHRLYPSLTFDDFIEKCEQLGSKKALKNFIFKMRSDEPLYFGSDDVVVDNESDDEDNANQVKDFDEIIANSFVNMNTNEGKKTRETEAMDSDFDDDIDDQDLMIGFNGSQLKTIDTNSQMSEQTNESNEQMNNGMETQEVNTNLDDEHMSEEQILREINSSD